MTAPSARRVCSRLRSSLEFMLMKLLSSGSSVFMWFIGETKRIFDAPLGMSSERGRFNLQSVSVISKPLCRSRTIMRVSSLPFGHIGTVTSTSTASLNRYSATFGFRKGMSQGKVRQKSALIAFNPDMIATLGPLMPLISSSTTILNVCLRHIFLEFARIFLSVLHHLRILQFHQQRLEHFR